MLSTRSRTSAEAEGFLSYYHELTPDSSLVGEIARDAQAALARLRLSARAVAGRTAGARAIMRTIRLVGPEGIELAVDLRKADEGDHRPRPLRAVPPARRGGGEQGLGHRVPARRGPVRRRDRVPRGDQRPAPRDTEEPATYTRCGGPATDPAPHRRSAVLRRAAVQLPGHRQPRRSRRTRRARRSRRTNRSRVSSRMRSRSRSRGPPATRSTSSSWASTPGTSRAARRSPSATSRPRCPRRRLRSTPASTRSASSGPPTRSGATCARWPSSARGRTGRARRGQARPQDQPRVSADPPDDCSTKA